MAGRQALLWTAVFVPSIAVMLAVAETAVRLDAHPVTAMVFGFATFVVSSEVLERLTAPFRATDTH